jgi:hypothetical protein
MILVSLIADAPDHETVVDYEIAKELLLPVEKMELPLSDITIQLIETLGNTAEAHLICDFEENSKSRNLFVRYYPAPAPIEDDVKVDDSR